MPIAASAANSLLPAGRARGRFRQEREAVTSIKAVIASVGALLALLVAVLKRTLVWFSRLCQLVYYHIYIALFDPHLARHPPAACDVCKAIYGIFLYCFLSLSPVLLVWHFSSQARFIASRPPQARKKAGKACASTVRLPGIRSPDYPQGTKNAAFNQIRGTQPDTDPDGYNAKARHRISNAGHLGPRHPTTPDEAAQNGGGRSRSTPKDTTRRPREKNDRNLQEEANVTLPLVDRASAEPGLHSPSLVHLGPGCDDQSCTPSEAPRSPGRTPPPPKIALEGPRAASLEVDAPDIPPSQPQLEVLQSGLGTLSLSQKPTKLEHDVEASRSRSDQAEPHRALPSHESPIESLPIRDTERHLCQPGPLTDTQTTGIRYVTSESSEARQGARPLSLRAAKSSKRSGSHTSELGRDEESGADEEEEEDEDDPNPDTGSGRPAKRQRENEFQCPNYAANPRTCRPKCEDWHNSKIAAVTRHVKADAKYDSEKLDQIEGQSRFKLTDVERWKRYFIIFGGREGGPGSQPYREHALPPAHLSRVVRDGLALDHQDAARSLHCLVHAKDERDAAIRRRYREGKSKLKRRRQEELEQSRREYEQASQTLLATPGRETPPTIVQRDSFEEAAILRGLTPSRRPSLAGDMVMGPGFPEMSPRQDPNHLMVPTGFDDPSSSRSAIIDQVMQDADGIARQQNHHEEQGSSDVPNHQPQGNRGFLDYVPLPDKCDCRPYQDKPWCRNCDRGFGSEDYGAFARCECPHEIRTPYCRYCKKVADCWCEECTKGSSFRSRTGRDEAY